MDFVVPWVREFLDLNEQLRLRAVSKRAQLYKTYYVLGFFSHCETQFFLELYYFGPFGTGRPLRTESVVIPNTNPVSWRLVCQHLCLLTEILGLDLLTALRNLNQNYLQIPLPSCRGN